MNRPKGCMENHHTEHVHPGNPRGETEIEKGGEILDK